MIVALSLVAGSALGLSQGADVNGINLFAKPMDMEPDLMQALTFYAPLVDNLQAFGAGNTTPTYTGAVTGAGALKTYIDRNTGLITRGVSGQPRFEASGYLAEGARTNLALVSCDLAGYPLVWVPVAVTTASGYSGPDGLTSATRLTATDTGAYITQSITSAAAVRITSVYVKRVTGAGAISLSNFTATTWEAVTVTSAWTRVATVASGAGAANPVVGIQIAVSGDAVDVSYIQHEVGAFVSSAIFTAGVAGVRNADYAT